jgi:penicillin V acylase-like amidase (Ntn superfamily)
MKSRRAIAIGVAAAVSLSASVSLACSRITWLGPDGQVVTGRSMDWLYPFNARFYIFPRGTQNDGAGGQNSLRWASKYGTVVVAGTSDPSGPVDATFDGMNEKGLAANLLYLGEADFGPAPEDDRPRVSFGAWVQYVLSNNATVEEAVAAIKEQSVYIVPMFFGPGKKMAPTVHLAISDASGDSAIVEFLKGKPVIHHGREFQIMTNSPTYDEQLTLNNYWKRLDGDKVLPGSHQSEDRFVRATYYLGQLPQTKDERQAIAGVFSALRNVSVPWGKIDPEHPNLAPTYWRTVIDQTRLVYYFESTLSPNTVWLDLKKINFGTTTGIRTLALEGNYNIQGSVNTAFKPAKNINYLAP